MVLANPANPPANIAYLGNPAVMRHNFKWQYTKAEFDEYVKCKNDVQYFVENYCKIIHLDRGLVNFNLYPYQREMFDLYNNNRFSIVLSCRQSGKSIGVCAYILWYALFHSTKLIALLANKGSTSREMLGRITLMLENVPFFLQPGTKSLNKGSISFSNNTRIEAHSTSASSIRGKSVNLLYLDEFAFVQNDEEFYTATYPVVTSGKNTKVIITSTLNGITDVYYRILQGAIQGSNAYKYMRVDWYDVPGRDEAWKKEQIENTSAEQFAREFGNELMVQGTTLIDPNILLQLKAQNPIKTAESAKIYEDPIEGHNYIMGVDVCKGRGIDYSTFSIIDVTQVPFRQVATFRDNLISPMVFPDIILKYAKAYNDAYVLIEANDHGGMVYKILYYDYEYENMYSGVVRNGRSLGLEVNNKVKRIGCSNLKDLVERKHLEILDKDTIEELNYFEHDGRNYSGKKGHHDDTVSPLVCFGYFSSMPQFEYISKNNMHLLMEEERNRLVSESVPFAGDFGKMTPEKNVVFEKKDVEGYTEQFVVDETFGVAVEKFREGTEWRF